MRDGLFGVLAAPIKISSELKTSPIAGSDTVSFYFSVEVVSEKQFFSAVRVIIFPESFLTRFN